MIADALYEEAEGGWAKNLPLERPEEDVDGAPPPPRTAAAPRRTPRPPHVEVNADAVRLAYNSLTHLRGLSVFLDHVLDAPARLAWLDVSCNELNTIGPELLSLPNLQVRMLSFLCMLNSAQRALPDQGKSHEVPAMWSMLRTRGRPLGHGAECV
jgi:hypothetical protein